MYAMRTLTRLLIAGSRSFPRRPRSSSRVVGRPLIDVNPPLPNVLLLIETPGLMEGTTIPSPTSGNTLGTPRCR